VQPQRAGVSEHELNPCAVGRGVAFHAYTLVGAARDAVGGSIGGTLACPPFPALARSRRRRLISSLRSAMPMCSSLPHGHGKRQCNAGATAADVDVQAPAARTRHLNIVSRAAAAARAVRGARQLRCKHPGSVALEEARQLLGPIARVLIRRRRRFVRLRAPPPHTPHARWCAGCLGPRDG
jgi:hypothetical protein